LSTVRKRSAYLFRQGATRRAGPAEGFEAVRWPQGSAEAVPKCQFCNMLAERKNSRRDLLRRSGPLEVGVLDHRFCGPDKHAPPFA